MKVKDLTDIQIRHLRWRLDAKTCCGYITAATIVKPEHECYNWDLEKIFKWVDCSDRSAKYHARKVMEWNEHSTLDNPKGLNLFDVINEYKSTIRKLKGTIQRLGKENKELKKGNS